jgi:hypothetical protein
VSRILSSTRGHGTDTVIKEMLIKHRYRAQGPWIEVRLQRKRDESDGFMSYVPARLWFNEDADLKLEPDFFDEVVKVKV